MLEVSGNFQAFVVDKQGEEFSSEVRTLTMESLPEEEVLIKVVYSSINYKDGLASTPDGKIVSSYPFIPGIDLAGIVMSSKNPSIKEGDEVIVTSYELGVSHFGGLSEYACVPANWIVPLPEGLTLKEAMVYGTAGFTAALSIQRLEEQGMSPEQGKVLVTGATGGVGSLAIAMLAKKSYEIVASTGKESATEFLQKIGAREIISREEVCGEKIRPLDKQQWMYAVDPVGGTTLAAITGKLKYGGSVAVSGLTGGAKVPVTVFPFILRSVNILGIDSVYCPMEVRGKLWQRMATDLKPENLEGCISEEIGLHELKPTFGRILQGGNIGRTIVKL